MRVIDIHTHGMGGYDTRTGGETSILEMARLYGSQGISVIYPTIYPDTIPEMRKRLEVIKRAIDIQHKGDLPEEGRPPGQQFSIKSSSPRDCSGLHPHNNLSDHIVSSPARNDELLFPGRSKEGLLSPHHGGISGSMKDETSEGEWTPGMGSQTRKEALIAGVHLEGPFLNPERSGALDRTKFLHPSEYAFKALIEGFEDIVKIITIAPELPGALGLIRKIRDMGIVVSMGHSDATYAQAEAGFHAGARGITHLFNAMRGFHHREPGLAGFGLLWDDIFVEVIGDPYHLHKKNLELIFMTKRRDRIILVSDSVKETGLKERSSREGSPYKDHITRNHPERGHLIQKGELPIRKDVSREGP